MSQHQQKLWLGCVADDFTGAADVASFLVNRGVETMLCNGVPPGAENIRDCAAVVIALKSRSGPVEEAVRDTRRALEWLKLHGALQFYIKYCSTFDSTRQGNIGPSVDCALEFCGERYTVICPALPVNGRVVKDGILYVDGIPLSEGHMSRHPLNPMWDSDIAKLMEPQGKYPCFVLGSPLLSKSREEILAAVEAFGAGKAHFYVIPDYADEAQGAKIAEVFGHLSLLSGGSGLPAHLANRRRAQNFSLGNVVVSGVPGKGIVLSGSCSKATREQIDNFRRNGGPCLGISAEKLLGGEQSADLLWSFVTSHAGEEALIYSDGVEGDSGTPGDSEQRGRGAAALEKVMSEIAVRASANGYTRIIVAGGETSGAVALALGYNSFLIGESIAPGVPVMVPVQQREVRLVLKSGNFGQPDFFRRALDMTRR